MPHHDKMCGAGEATLTHQCRLLASGAADATVSVFDLQTLTCLRTFAGVDQPIRYVSFSHDGRYLAYVEGGASVDPGVYIEEVATGAAFLRLNALQCSTWLSWWDGLGLAEQGEGGRGEGGGGGTQC